MTQDILTYITITAALGVSVYRIIRFSVRTARGENPGCSSCSLHHLHTVKANKDIDIEQTQFPNRFRIKES